MVSPRTVPLGRKAKRREAQAHHLVDQHLRDIRTVALPAYVLPATTGAPAPPPCCAALTLASKPATLRRVGVVRLTNPVPGTGAALRNPRGPRGGTSGAKAAAAASPGVLASRAACRAAQA